MEARDEQTKPEYPWEGVKYIHRESLMIWRIKNNVVEKVDDMNYGVFLNDAVYIIMKASNKQRKICYDLHFWVPLLQTKNFKTNPPEQVVELAALLNDAVIYHKEIENYESNLLKGYFKTFITFQGDTEYVFKEDNPTAYKPRLLSFQLNGTRAALREVPSSVKSLNSHQVLVLDNGLSVLQWNGKFCSDEDRSSAAVHIENLLSKRSGKLMREFYDEEDLLEDNPFTRLLGNDDVDREPEKQTLVEKAMLRLNDDSGELKLIPVFKGRVSRAGLEPSDVNFIDTPTGLFVYIGPTASVKERESVWKEADKYLVATTHPFHPIKVIKAGEKSYEFEEIWDDFI